VGHTSEFARSFQVNTDNSLELHSGNECDQVDHHPDLQKWWGVWKNGSPPIGHASYPPDYVAPESRPIAKKAVVSPRRPKNFCSKTNCKMALNMKCSHALCAVHCLDSGGCTVHKPRVTHSASIATASSPTADWDVSDFQDPGGDEEALMASAMAELCRQQAHPLPPDGGTSSSSYQVPPPMTMSHEVAVSLLQPMSQRPPTCSTQLSALWVGKKAVWDAERTQKEIDDAERSKAEEDMKRNLNILWFDQVGILRPLAFAFQSNGVPSITG